MSLGAAFLFFLKPLVGAKASAAGLAIYLSTKLGTIWLWIVFD